MARPLRFEYPRAFHHFTSRENERKRIFSAKAAYTSSIAIATLIELLTKIFSYDNLSL